jgi:hypothetical protein
MLRLLAVSAIATIVTAFVIHLVPPTRALRPWLGRGPGRICALPNVCVGEKCDELVEMPLAGPGYVDVRLDTEQTPDSSTSYLRRDLQTLVRYAAAKVACKTVDWPTGNGGEIALGDMSERDGSTPGTRAGSPRHPKNTHVGGRDIDIAYFQRDTLDNQLRPICKHQDHRVEMYRCIAQPTRLDAWRTALFIGVFLEDARVRVIGIDGLAAVPILAAFDELCETEWIERSACERRGRITFETADTGRGWFRGHHNHMHVSWWRQ